MPGRGDVALAAVVTVVSVVSFFLNSPLGVDPAAQDGPMAGPDALGAVEVAIATGLLAWRRVVPGLVLAVVLASHVARYAEGYPLSLMPYSVIVAVYTVADRWPLRRAAVASAVAALILVTGVMALVHVEIDDEPVTLVVSVFAAFALGRLARTRRERTALAEERARLLDDRSRLLLQDQENQLTLAVARERATIAHELHDVVANNVGLIVAHSGRALARAPLTAEHVRATLSTLDGLGRETLRDMRGLVRLWHTEEADALTPPTLDRVEDLVTRWRETGADVAVTVVGTPVQLPPVVEQAAYRVVQESLTNAMKHAPGARVAATITYSRGRLEVLVESVGGRLAEQPSTGGSGISGLHQRVELLGGRLDAGPTAFGFQVHAVLPFASTVEP